MKRIFILVYALIAGIITAVIFYLVLKAKFPAFFNSWYFKWHVAAFIKYTSVAILVAVIACLIDLLKHRGDGSKVFIIKNVLHFYKNIAALTGRELTYIFWMITLTLSCPKIGLH